MSVKQSLPDTSQEKVASIKDVSVPSLEPNDILIKVSYAAQASPDLLPFHSPLTHHA